MAADLDNSRCAAPLGPVLGAAPYEQTCGVATYARLLDVTGRTDEAFIKARRAVELNPLSPSPNLMLGGVFYAGRQYDRAIEQLRHTTEAFPDYAQGYAILGLAYEAKAMHRTNAAPPT